MLVVVLDGLVVRARELREPRLGRGHRAGELREVALDRRVERGLRSQNMGLLTPHFISRKPGRILCTHKANKVADH